MFIEALIAVGLVSATYVLGRAHGRDAEKQEGSRVLARTEPKPATSPSPERDIFREEERRLVGWRNTWLSIGLVMCVAYVAVAVAVADDEADIAGFVCGATLFWVFPALFFTKACEASRGLREFRMSAIRRKGF